MYQLVVYVPESHVDSLKTALFAAGAGRFGNYDSCCWQTLGQGQFRPLAGSNPHIGQRGALEVVNEYRLEMVVEDAVVRQVVAALYQAHPYEEPAYTVVRAIPDFAREHGANDE
ncbi:MAG: NGG1p interacting factor NIF3 [Gammaproteobacteria bacterium]|nr:MAG: NGG1p interacting factor NIF3 [Gammaproteobacteria bacterium]